MGMTQEVFQLKLARMKAVKQKIQEKEQLIIKQ
jgi:hypothetical protein